MKILFFIDSLSGSAGTERISTNLVNSLVERGYTCRFLVLSKNTNSFFSVHPLVEIDSLSCPFSHRLEAIKKLRAYLKSYKPDYLVNIAVQMIQISSLSTLGLSVRTITWEHFSMAAASGFGGKLQRLFASIASKKLIVLTNQDRKAYPFFLRSKILVIPNFTNLNRTNELSYLNNKVVLSVGRFHNHHKGFDQ